MIYRPDAAREAALNRSEIAALIVNAVNGMLLMTALWIQMSFMFTVPLIITIGVLFGPLFGFIVSSGYSRVNWFIGRRLGSPASYNDLYRIFAWSFLPFSFAALLTSMVFLQFDKPDPSASAAILVPLIIICILTVRNYLSNIAAIHQFTWLRGATSTVLSFILTLCAFLLAIAVAFLLLGGAVDELKEFILLLMGLE
jgi:hypothetical protein